MKLPTPNCELHGSSTIHRIMYSPKDVDDFSNTVDKTEQDSFEK